MTTHGSTKNTNDSGQRRAGDLDPAFGDGGLARVTLDYLNPGTSQPMKDKSVLSITNLGLPVGLSEMIWVRHLPDGTRDPSFGDGGILSVKYPANNNLYEHSGFIVLPSGAFLLAGNLFDLATGDVRLSFMKFSEAGVFDTSFGEGGIVEVEVPDRRLQRVGSVSSHEDGIVATGYAVPSMDILFRLNDDGTKHKAFGNDGSVALHITKARVSVLSDGKLLVIGSVGSFGLVSRYEGNGALDSQFGDGGRFEIELEDGFPRKWNERAFGWVDVADAAVQPDGRIVIVGSTQSTENGDVWAAWIARLAADGKGFDNEFNSGRPLMLELPEGTMHGNKEHAVQIQPDGKIVSSGTTGWPTYRGTLRRFLADGTPDADFGQNGLVMTERVGEQTETKLNGLNIQDDEKIVASGNIFDAGYSIAIYRFLGA